MNLSHGALGRSVLLTVVVGLTTSVYTVRWATAQQATDAQTAYEQALGLLQSGKNNDALALLNHAIVSGARDPSLYNLKGLVESELGRNQEAEESFRTVTRLAPQSAMGYNNLGVLLSQLGRYQDAATAFREGEVREPKNFTALLGLGTCLVALHKYTEAANYLERAWGVRPGDFQAGYEWALALRESKQPAAARKILNQFSAPQNPDSGAKYYSLAGVVAEDLKDFAAAAESYRRAYAINSGSYEIYLALLRAVLAAGSPPAIESLPSPPENLSAAQDLALGLLLASHDAYEPAISRFQESLQRDPSNEVATINLALAYKSVDKPAAAIDLLHRTLGRKPSAALYNLLASLQEEGGQYVEAVENFQRAVELDPSSEQYYFDLGMEYLAHFTFGPAAEVFQAGTQRFPKISRQYLGLAYSHYALREYAEATDNFTKALEIEPESLVVFRAWQTVLTFVTPKDGEKLLPRLERLANAHPQSAELAFCYGAVLFHAEQAKGPQAALDRPQSLLEKAIRLRPDFPQAHLELGSLYAAGKQDQKAVDQYQEAIRQDPKSDVAHYRLGQVYRDMNKLDLATEELARYQELSRLHQEELKRSRSAIKQFVLSQSAKPGEQ